MIYKTSKNNSFLDSIDELPTSAKICLYGAGDGGGNFKRLLEKYRQDIKITCFIDDFKSGEREGIKIITLDKALAGKGRSGRILVTSTYHKEISENLAKSGIRDYVIVNPWLFFNFQIITDDDLKRYSHNFGKVRELLATAEDRTLYDAIVGMRRLSHCPQNASKEFLRMTKSFRAEYVDFVNMDMVTTIIEGGVGNGGNTIVFLDLIKDGGIIYGFDPFTEVYMKSKYRSHLERSGRVKLYPYALWNRRGKAKFFIDEYNKDGARIINDKKADMSLRDVKTTSIDSFVREHKIEKVDFIKLDIEGAELNALRGAVKTLVSHRPQIAVCIYHKKEDLFEIPLYLSGILKDYIYRIGHYTTSFWGTVWYCIPKACYRK